MAHRGFPPQAQLSERDKQIQEIMAGHAAYVRMSHGNLGAEGLVTDQNKGSLDAFSNQVKKLLTGRDNETGSLSHSSITDEQIKELHKLYEASNVSELERRRKEIAQAKMEGASLQEQHKLKKAEARQKPATSVQGATFQVEGVSNRDHIKDAATSKAIRMGDNNIVGWVLIMLVLLLIKAAKENKARNEMERVASQLSQGKGLNGDASLKDLRMEVTRDGGTGRLSCKFSQIKRDAKGKVVFDKDGVPEKEPVDAQDPRAKKAINMMCANLGLDSPVDGKPKAATTLAAATPAAATTSLSPVTAGVSPAAPMSGAASTAAAPESVVPGVGP